MEATAAPPPHVPRALAAWRTVIAYLAVIAVDTWLLFVIQDVQMGRDMVDDIALGTDRFLRSSLVLVPIVAAVLIPAAVLTRDLAWRRPAAAWAGRALAGGIAWAGWGAIVAVMWSSSSGLVYFSGSTLAGLAILAISGAVFALAGLRNDEQPPGRLAIGTALAVAMVVLALGLFMAGRWGGPA